VSRHHHGARIRNVVERGWRVLVLENEVLRVELLPGKGSDIVSFLHKPTDTDPLWRSAAGLRPPPSSGRLAAGDAASYLDAYEGGWQECFPNGGAAVTYRGAQIPFHGELWAADWDVLVVEDEPGRVAVLLSTETARTPFRVEKRLTLEAGRSVLQIDEAVTNLSPEPVAFMWGHHPAFGPPFLDESCRIDVPATTGTTSRGVPLSSSRLAFGERFDWPLASLAEGGTLDLSRVPPSEADHDEWVCLSGFAEGWYGITSGRRRVGFGLRWDAAVFPYLWYWQVWGGDRGYPWWGRHYNCALEPWTSWPDAGLNEAIANGSARTLQGGERLETRLLAVAYDGRDGISGIGEDGTVA
jgi:hypothetical protein